MMKKEIINVNDSKLDSISDKSLLQIESEANIIMQSLNSSIESIGNKANSYFQIIIVLVTGTIGYIVSTIDNKNSNIILLIASLVFVSFALRSALLMHKVIFPKSFWLNGRMPYLILDKNVSMDKKNGENNSDDENYNKILKESIYTLNNSVQENMLRHEERVGYFKKASKTLLNGFIYAIFSVFIVYISKLLFCF